MIFFAVLSARIVRAVLRLFNKGATTLPGRVALFFKYDILTRLSESVRIICVTGTNGKTTTCALIEHALKSTGKSCFVNKSGANMLTGVTSAFIENCTLSGRCKKNFAILECDENSLPLISRYLDAEVLAVTNVFRDQLDRYGEVTHTLGAIRNSAVNMPSALLVINADCPLTNTLSSLDNGCVRFGIVADFGDIDISEARYCPLCSAELLYTSRVFAHLGSYRCPKCGYTRGSADFEACDIKLLGDSGSRFALGGQPFHTALGGIYNVYNIICAAAVLSSLGINTAPLSTFAGAFGRTETFTNGDVTVLLMLVKNPVGLSSCVSYIAELAGEHDVILALNDNPADGRDISWIWDSEIDPLCRMNALFYTFGTRAADMTLRLKYNGIAVTDTLDGDNTDLIMRLISHGSRDVIILANYTAMMKIRKALRRNFGGKEFWE